MSQVPYHELVAQVARVRRRWRLRVALQGVAALVAVLLGWLVIGTWGLEALRFAPAAVLVGRLAGWLLLAAVLFRFVARPLARRVSDRQVALYIEEQRPDLRALLVSAVEAADPPGRTDRSPLADHVIAQAVTAIRAEADGRSVETVRLQRAGAWAAVLVAVTVLGLGIGPAWFRDGGRTLLVPWRDAVAATPYAIRVVPGDVTVARGGDLEILARLDGFTSDNVALLLRAGESPDWQSLPMMAADSTGAFGYRLFDLTADAQYLIEANGIRSRPFVITVADLPAVGHLVIELAAPPHTRRPLERLDPGGDIVAPRGTSARFLVRPTLPAAAGRLVTDQGDTVPLRPGADGLLEGRLRLSRSSAYRIDLQAREGPWVEASLSYRIDVLDDGGPTVVFKTPGRDLQATAVEEVFAEAVATDDYGIRTLELRYRVNGGDERVVVLADSGRRAEVSAGHTFFLEEHALAAGDLISYFARATDNGPGGGQAAASDIYFIRIRPFGRDYRQAESRGTPAQQQSGESPGELSEQQRQIVAATYRVQRDSAAIGSQQVVEDLAMLALAQGQLRERVVALLVELTRRGGGALDSTFALIHAELQATVPAQQAAEEQLGLRQPAAALGPEQQALQHLQRAEAVFREVQVSREGQPGGAPGGGSQSNAEDLADLSELETDKLRNQYESLPQSAAQQNPAELDETLERLKQLASRQQQEQERLRRAAEQLQDRAGGAQSGASQRRLAEEAEQLARQLERLSRERQSPELAEAARQMQQATEEMRRSASGQAGSEARAGAAANRLREATRSLESGRQAQAQRRLDQARGRAEELAEREREIARDQDRALAQGAPSTEAARQLGARKDSLAADVGRLEQDLDRMSRETRGDRPGAGRDLQGAADGLRQGRVQDRIRFSKGFLRGASPEYARNFEEQIATLLDTTAARIGAAGRSLAAADSGGAGRAMDRTGDLVRGLESLTDRMEQAGAGRPGFADPSQARQFSRELRERRVGADSLRQELEALDLETADLERVIREMQRLETGQLFANAEAFARLQRDVLDRLKAFEFALRRRFEGDAAGRPVIGSTAEIPPQFRELVEEYYRSLARTRRP
jgi:hypothetical protein